MSTLASPVNRINPKDPSGLRSTEDTRAAIAQQDLDVALARIVQRAQNETDPLQIQRIVTEELSKYEGLATQKNVLWVVDTMNRSTGRADLMLKTLGVQVVPSLGPRGINAQLRDALTVNVKNEISSLTASTQQKVTQALIEGVDNGDGPRQIAKNIVDATGMERNRAVMIARTETMRANVETSVAQYRRYGIQQLKWLAASDERTCDECGDGGHNGEIYDIDDAPDCPAHPNCRCVLLPVIGEEAAQ